MCVKLGLSHEGTNIDYVQEQGAVENVWIQEGGNFRRPGKIG
jgi:hypothetical protein